MTVLFGQFGFCCACYAYTSKFFHNYIFNPKQKCKGSFYGNSLFSKKQSCYFLKRRYLNLVSRHRRNTKIQFCTVKSCLPNNQNINFSEDRRTTFIDFKENGTQVDEDHESKLYQLEEDEDELIQDLDQRDYLISKKLVEYLDVRKNEAQIQSEYPMDKDAILDWWVAAVDSKKFKELQNLYGNFGIFFLENFPDFAENKLYEGKLTPKDKAILKARRLYSCMGVPAIADSLLFVIEPGGSHSQGYQFEQLDDNVDRLLETLRTTSKPNRVTTFYSYVAYCDGERELVEEGICEVDIFFAHSSQASIASSTAFDNLMLRLRTDLHLPAYRPDDEMDVIQNADAKDAALLSKSVYKRQKLPGAVLLADRLLHEADLLQGNLIKVTSFLNHQVDVSLMESCGKDLASLLRDTNPTKILTIETSGLLPAITVSRELGLFMVYARHGKSITMSDCIHTFYRSQTKGELYELVISREYLGENDRVVIIDDFLAGGSTLDALIRLANMAGTEVCGIGVLIERTDMGGRAFLSGYNIPIFSLVRLSVSSEGLRVENIDKF
ncbi:Xanthine phosphoribosyltransferase [Galdieria sulphuraria]|nr:Xanthine phosphoribosyltransferase [Galdieria sulphuraria]